MRNGYKRYHYETEQDQTRLMTLLAMIEQMEKQEVYDLRNRAIFAALGLASAIGFKGGIRIDPLQPEWPVVFIELPTGQVSWHIPAHEPAWDGHTSEEKYERIRTYIQQVYERSAGQSKDRTRRLRSHPGQRPKSRRS
jgi:hypothetical protein